MFKKMAVTYKNIVRKTEVRNELRLGENHNKNAGGALPGGTRMKQTSLFREHTEGVCI